MASKSEEEAIRALSKTWYDAVEANDTSTAMECFTPDFEIWHNVDEKTKDKEYVQHTLSGGRFRIKDVKYHDRRVFVLPGMLVQQHTLEATRGTF